MRKFLSLVLALVMMMSLVTINAGAKEFTDGDDIKYDEAVDVISTIKVVDGYANGSFNPGGNLTRGAAAKIICNLILGPTTASELRADTAPFRDVPVNHDFAGYIAYCQKEGIISGYANGSFAPAGTLTGFAFMKMLLGALGYDAEIEQYVGPNWTINVTKRAIGIGLEDGLEADAFDGSKFITREEACLYAFNTLQADLVSYDQRITANVNGAEVTVGNSLAQSRKWNSQATRINNIREDDIIQFAEEYFNKLEKKTGDDDFMRPAYTWIYDKEEIGTYVDWSLMREEYTTEVTGRELYDLLGSSLINDSDIDLVYYFNGDQPDDDTILPSWVVGGSYTGDKDISKETQAIRRNNQDAVGFTGDGVLTQVFVDKDNRESIIITSIDTWLSKADADYNESRDTVPVNVWTEIGGTKGWNVDVEEVPEIVDVKEGEFYLANISFKDNTNGEIVILQEPEIMEEAVVTKFSTKNNLPTKLTTGGTEYKQNVREYYDTDALYEYDETLLTDRDYNIILDQYGYVIGIELNEGEKKYVFITGFDRPMSNLSVKTANAAGIFLDGTMQEIKVNVTDTDKKIKAVNGQDGNPAVMGGEYFLPWQSITTKANQDGWHVLNRWFTYTVTDAGVYTLKPVTNMVAYKNPTTNSETIKTDNLYLDDNVMVVGNFPYQGVNYGPTAATINGEFGGILPTVVGTPAAVTAVGQYDMENTARCYGNDDSVYITVETDIVDTLTNKAGSISGVTGVYTGVQSVEIEIDPVEINNPANNRYLDEAYIYAAFDSDNYIVGAVTVGEGNGGNATIAFVTDGVKSERIEDGVYYWEFEAIVNGSVQTLTVKDKYGSVMNKNQLDKTDVNNEAQALKDYKSINEGKPFAGGQNRNWNAVDGIVELRFDADNYVVGIKSVEESKIYSYYGNKTLGIGTQNYYGSDSEVDADNGSTYKNAVVGKNVIKDAKAYRIGAIDQIHVGGTDVTWNTTDGVNNYYHHYDSAPEELKLVGRTLYVTSNQIDEGVALTSDAKGIVIQRENDKWKTREFSSVSSAIAQVKDADETVDGKQFNGQIIGLMDGSARAHTIILISDQELNSKTGVGGQTGLKDIDVVHDVSSTSIYRVPTNHTDLHLGYDNTERHIDFALIGAEAGKTYSITLQQYDTDKGWINIATKAFKVTASDSNYQAQDILSDGRTGEVFTWDTGRLNNTGGYQYRLICGGVTSGFMYAI